MNSSLATRLVTSTFLMTVLAAPAAANTAYSNVFTVDLRSLHATITYVALGDSYSSGEGAGSYITFNNAPACHRSANAYSRPVNEVPLSVLFPSVAREFFACSGAETSQVIEGGFPADEVEGGKDADSQLSRMRALTQPVDMVTMTIGGNDIGFGPVVQYCLLFDHCMEIPVLEDPLGRTMKQYMLDSINQNLPSRLDSVYGEIRDTAPDASILVLGYPQVFPEAWADQLACWVQTGGGLIGNGISPPEQDDLREVGDALNQAVYRAATSAGVHYVPPFGFGGHEACTPEPYLWPLRLPTVESFHPNQMGQTQYAAALNYFIVDWLRRGLPRNASGLPANSSVPAQAAAVALSSGPTIGELRFQEPPPGGCASSIGFGLGQPVQVSGHGFAPAANVTLRLTASDGSQLSLDRTTATSGGTLDALVTLPSAPSLVGPAIIEAAGTGEDLGHRLLLGRLTLFATAAEDGDGDGIPDRCDNCMSAANPSQSDGDQDGLGDACDGCPNDSQNDVDGDGLCADVDQCPLDTGNDADGDGICAPRDNCPTTINPDQADADRDGVGDVCEVSLATPGENVLVIPAAAHASGAAATNWVSDAVLHNPGVAAATAQVFFLRSSQDNSVAVPWSLVVAAGTSKRLSDVIKGTFGEASATGALLLAADSNLLVTSRTYNNLATGTYGQYIEGFPLVQAVEAGQEARLIQLTKNASYRTNIGFANAGESDVALEVGLFGPDGTSLGTRNYTIQPFGHFQENDIIGKVTSASVDDAYAVVKSTTSGAKYFTYASVVDNRSGDPIAVIPPAAGTGAIYVPGGAALSGTGGTNWKTDLEIHNPGTTQANYSIALLRRDQANPSPTTESFSLGPGQSVRYAHVLSTVFGVSGAATLRITPTSGQVIAAARTYNDQPSGTYGQFIAGAFESQAIANGQEGRLVQLSQSSSDAAGFRTNLGLVNVSGLTISVEAKLYRCNGALLGTRTYSLGAFESRQVDRVFREVAGEDVGDGFAVLQTTTPGGVFFGYASVVDNRSGDPIYIPARVSGAD